MDGVKRDTALEKLRRAATKGIVKFALEASSRKSMRINKVSENVLATCVNKRRRRLEDIVNLASELVRVKSVEK